MSDHPHLESALPDLSEARDIIRAAGDSVFPLQYKGSKFDFYRFANRYRMAVRFQGISLEDFGDETEAGYSALGTSVTALNHDQSVRGRNSSCGGLRQCSRTAGI